ncbi:type II toxin-antitoxin system HicA family toxin [Oleidesulfovibrio alaskensis]|uniref:type II toxin-antitoxin system HicA family toxin n=1 Tax=Oleidesulfovibrio alaskensis TaxID=58180 RepID=UPI0012DF4BE0|nr:type II toxin-antitoxin system HicA family toxin [Oleidesulfovibrio alaskensis]
MKEKHLLLKLRLLGFTFQEGRSHTKVYDSHGNKVLTIPRHKEIKDHLVRVIGKQVGKKIIVVWGGDSPPPHTLLNTKGYYGKIILRCFYPCN